MNGRDLQINEDLKSIGASTDPLRLKIVKRLQKALEQINGGVVQGDDRPDWHNDLSTHVSRGFEVVPEDLFAAGPVINIKERPFLDFDERVREQVLLGEPKSTQIFELLVQGWPKDDSTTPLVDKVDATYLLLEDVRRRIAFLKFDESHPDRVFRISGKHNTCLRLSHGDGTVAVDESSNQPGFWLRLILFLVEDFADSARGDA